MVEWNYGDAYKRHPIGEKQTAIFNDNSKLKVHDIFNPLPQFMLEADLIFVDPPWNIGNLNTFYTKAELQQKATCFEPFYKRLFECIRQISPKTCYCEIGKEYLAEFIFEMRKLYRFVTFYNSTYYHKKTNLCYVVRGSGKRVKLPLDGLDEEDIIEWVCKNEQYQCIGDLCMGKGLVAYHATVNGKQFVGTELNPKRLSVTIESVSKLGLQYRIVS